MYRKKCGAVALNTQKDGYVLNMKIYEIHSDQNADVVNLKTVQDAQLRQNIANLRTQNLWKSSK